MFKKLQEQGADQASSSSKGSNDADGNKSSDDCKESRPTSQTDVKSESLANSDSKPAAAASNKPLFVGKRRGGRFLATGKVKKLKLEQEEEEAPPKDAWSLYLAEVKKYKQTTCEEEGKTRPLVK